MIQPKTPNNTHTNPNESLELLARDYEAWREQRATFTEQAPAELAKRAISLLADYKVSQVINALRINSRKLKQWQQQFSNASTSKRNMPSEDAFIAVNMDLTSTSSAADLHAQKADSPTAFSPLTLRYPNGLAVTMPIPDSFSTQQLVDLLRSLA